MRQRYRIAIAITVTILLLFLPSAALAHDENRLIRFGPFLAGVTEPLRSFQFVLATFATGVIATLIGGKEIWQVLGIFTLVTAASMGIGLLDFGLPALEIAVPVIILILGIAILVGHSLPVAAAFLVVGLFAIFYGYQVGVDIAAIDLPQNFMAGFLVGAIPLYFIGIILGDVPRHYGKGANALRAMGGLVTVCGLLHLFGVL